MKAPETMRAMPARRPMSGALRNARTVLVVGAMLALLAACAAVRPKAPEVVLHSLRLVEAGLVEQRFALTLTIRNPNPGDYAITGISYAAEVDGKPFASGVSRQRFVIAGYGEGRIEVPATTRLADLVRGLSGGIDLLLGERAGGELDYRVHGTVEVEGLGRLPFDRRGKFRPGGERKPAPEPPGRA